MNDAHRIHAITRKELIFEEREANWEDADAANKKFDQDRARSNDAYQTLIYKLGVNGAEHFLDLGVAGVNPLATNIFLPLINVSGSVGVSIRINRNPVIVNQLCIYVVKKPLKFLLNVSV